jgi:hypothetical protein
MREMINVASPSEPARKKDPGEADEGERRQLLQQVRYAFPIGRGTFQFARNENPDGIAALPK